MRNWLLLMLLSAAGCGIVDSIYYERLLDHHADAGPDEDEDDAGSARDAN